MAATRTLIESHVILLWLALKLPRLASIHDLRLSAVFIIPI